MFIKTIDTMSDAFQAPVHSHGNHRLGANPKFACLSRGNHAMIIFRNIPNLFV